MQKIFRCAECQRSMRAVGSTGLAKEAERKAKCPYCGAKNAVLWPRGDKFRIQRIAAR